MLQWKSLFINYIWHFENNFSLRLKSFLSLGKLSSSQTISCPSISPVFSLSRILNICILSSFDLSSMSLLVSIIIFISLSFSCGLWKNFPNLISTSLFNFYRIQPPCTSASQFCRLYWSQNFLWHTCPLWLYRCSMRSNLMTTTIENLLRFFPCSFL